MKVASLIDALNRGGAERQVLNTAWALTRRGCDVEFIYYHTRNAANPAYEHAAFREARVTRIPKEGRRLRFRRGRGEEGARRIASRFSMERRSSGCPR